MIWVVFCSVVPVLSAFKAVKKTSSQLVKETAASYLFGYETSTSEERLYLFF